MTTNTDLHVAMPELLPCPFCGFPPIHQQQMDESLWSHDTVPWRRVQCTGCEIGTDYVCDGYEPNEIEAWNSRAEGRILVVYLDEDPIDVEQFYRAKGFEELPTTPTMTGAEIRECGWKKNNYQMYLIPPDGAPSVPVGDAQAIPVVNGMRFWCIPPATAAVA